MERFEKKLKIETKKEGKEEIKKGKVEIKEEKQELIENVKDGGIKKIQDILEKKEGIADEEITERCQENLEYIISCCNVDAIREFISFCQENNIELNLSSEKLVADCQDRLKYYLAPKAEHWRHFSWGGSTLLVKIFVFIKNTKF